MKAWNILRLAGALAAAAVLGACNDPLRADAILDTQLDTLSTYTVSSAPLGYPSVVAAFLAGYGPQAVPLSSSTNFDFGFDYDSLGRLSLVPARLIRVSGAPSLGLQRVNRMFEQVTSAPSGGYALDSAMVIQPGQVVALETFPPAGCPYYSTAQFGKLVVDSVVGGSRVYFRIAMDPNCGYHDLIPGTIPKN